jgi:hypothetical protein
VKTTKRDAVDGKSKIKDLGTHKDKGKNKVLILKADKPSAWGATPLPLKTIWGTERKISKRCVCYLDESAL